MPGEDKNNPPENMVSLEKYNADITALKTNHATEIASLKEANTKALEKARTDEKAKVYSEVEKANKEVEKFKKLYEDTQAELDTKSSSDSELVKEVETLKATITENSTLIEKQKEEIKTLKKTIKDGGDTVSKETEEKLAKAEEALAKMQEQISSLINENSTNKLNSVKASYASQLHEDFRDLLTGGNEEEIKASYEMLKVKQDKIFSALPPANNHSRMPSPTLSKIADATKEMKPADIQKMSMEDFGKFIKESNLKI